MNDLPSMKYLLALWGKVVMLRDGYTCQKCGRKNAKNPHHIFTRSRRSTAFLLKNGVNLCFDCHLGNPYNSAHKSPAEFKKWLINHWMTEKEYDDLEITSKLVYKVDRWAIKEYLMNELRKLEKENEL